MDTNKTWTITAVCEITSDNEEWREQIDNGIEAPEVTGGMIKLPQGGERKSKAAITGGIFEEGSEAATYASENAYKIMNTVLQEELEAKMSDFIEGNSNIEDLEFLLTNIAKSEYNKIAGEFKDNADEAVATDMVINSLLVKISIEGMPTKDEIMSYITDVVTDFFKQSIGGGSS